MTTEEKLEKCLDFIRKVERLDKSKYDTFDLNDVMPRGVYCDECGADVEVEPRWPDDARENTEYIDYSVIDDLSDKAWHLLADVEGL